MILLQNQAAKNLNLLLDKLHIDYRDCGYVLIGKCPVHNGDNPSAFNIYRESKKYGYPNGGWVCNTRHCEREYGNNLIGLIRAVKNITQQEAMKWLCEFCECKNIDDITDTTYQTKDIYDNSALIFEDQNIQKHKYKFTERFFTSRLEVPAKYFLRRGVPANILYKYKVGYNKHTNRVDVPIYDNLGEFIVGKTSRSIFEKCPKCGCHHNPVEECPVDKHKYSKWQHIGIAKCNFLYNFWYAQDKIRKTGKVILVESPGNVWKLVENGVENCVACLGSSFSDYQEILLSSCGVISIYTLFDNDAAGKRLTQHLDKTLKKRYNIIKLNMDLRFNDIMECPNQYIQDNIITQL